MTYKSTLLSSELSNVTSVSEEHVPSLMVVNPDTEPVIKIDLELRKIIIPTELYNIGVAGDHFSETIYFSCQRYFDGEDLSNHSCIIRCINARNEYFETPVVEMTVTESALRFGWQIDNRATRYSGTINFTVQFETVNNNSGIKYQWQTTPATLKVLSGLNIEETITEKDNALFTKLSNQVQILQQKVDNLITMADKLFSIEPKFNELALELEKLKNNVVYIYDDI